MCNLGAWSISISEHPHYIHLIASRLSLLFSRPPRPLELVKAGLRAGEGDTGLGLLGRVDDLAVVDDNGVPVGPLVAGPADGLGELEVGVAHEELQAVLVLHPTLFSQTVVSVEDLRWSRR